MSEQEEQFYLCKNIIPSLAYLKPNSGENSHYQLEMREDIDWKGPIGFVGQQPWKASDDKGLAQHKVYNLPRGVG